MPEATQSGVAAIAAGGEHTVALKTDGSVVAWGYNFFGQTTVPVAARSGVVAIAAGHGHTVALIPLKPFLALPSTSNLVSTGTVIHGHTNPNGQPTVLTVEYGPTAAYGSTAVIDLAADDGFEFVSGSATLSGLTPGTTYHYRLVATSPSGTTVGVDQAFTTPTSSLTPLESWRQERFGTTASTGQAADNADPDGDGVANLLEFAFGLNPLSAASRTTPTWTIGASESSLTFPRPASNLGVVFSAEWSASLTGGSWTAIPDTGTPQQLLFRAPHAGQPRLFLRLRATVP